MRRPTSRPGSRSAPKGGYTAECARPDLSRCLVGEVIRGGLVDAEPQLRGDLAEIAGCVEVRKLTSAAIGDLDGFADAMREGVPGQRLQVVSGRAEPK